MLLQQQQRKQQQQQQQRSHVPPTAAEVQQSVEQRVEALKEQGNAHLKAGQLREAESAYMEALQLDGDNAKVLLNLAQLRLAQKDGAGAVRAAEEVLALQGVGEEPRRKATLRWVQLPLHRPCLGGLFGCCWVGAAL
jgi:tetratricopeptide (TPR) repeat protein